MSSKWRKIYSTQTSYKSEILKGLLENTSIKTILVNKKDSMHTHSNGTIELYVEQENVLRAIHLIRNADFE